MHYSPDTSACGGHCIHELIRARAYQLFEARGRADGQDEKDWLQAEREVQQHLGFEPSSPCHEKITPSS